MRNVWMLFPLILVLLASGGCGGGSDQAAGNGSDTLSMARVRAMEDSLYARPGVDRKGAQALLDVYLMYAQVYPLDSMTPEYLFRGASLRSTLGDPKGGIALYDRIIRDFPHWRKIADTYYLKAFTIDNGLGQKGEAQSAYQTVIEKFPDHRFAKESALMIENLKYTDEELVARFQQMNADSTAAQANTRP
ncbi:MAG: tetratricopeptide repeat protein [Flavobacteriales bacterium]|nr:tetratricopeptide repeat protein [Flavobacteriales bacterium]